MPTDCLCQAPPSVALHGCDGDLVFTSQPYPVHVLEQLTCSAALTGMFMWKPPSDDLDTACALASGALTVTASYGSYSNYGFVAWDGVADSSNSREAEWLECSANLSHGALYATATFSTYNWPAEEMQSACNLVSGDLTVTAGYISYLNYQTEELQTACALVSGSLS